MDSAYARLRADVVAGRLPQGVRVNEARLAREFGVSRAPIREAVRVLTHEGLLNFAPHLGCFVVRLTPGHIAELMDIRELLEPGAYTAVFERKGATMVGPLFNALRKMTAAAALGDAVALTAAHSQFHGEIYLSAGPVFARTWANMDASLQMHLNVGAMVGSLTVDVEEHEELLQFMAEGTGAEALRNHIEKHRLLMTSGTGAAAP